MSVVESLDALGLLLLAYRLWPRRKPKPLPLARYPFVSIIVPARNEETNLPALLTSLGSLDYPHYEVLVLDDASTDRTAAVAESYPVRVLRGKEKPSDWFGKPWACHQASLEARGDFLLFTDADTVHEKGSLRTAVARMISDKAQGLSALPYHLNPAFWERLMGPFQSFLIALTNPYGKPRDKQVFAIGQYLLFEAEFYRSIGGHEAIKDEAVDDLSLARLTLARNGQWSVHTGKPLFKVRMYDSLGAFVRGWRRNFRGGFRHNSRLSAIEVTLYIMALTAVRDPSLLTFAISLVSLAFLAFTQRSLGRFSFLGILLYPVSLGAFTIVTLLAVYDQLLRRPLQWKSRAYRCDQVPNLPA